MRRGLLAGLAAVICAAGLLRDVSVHAWKEKPFRARAEQRRADARFRFVASLLPAGVERVRFLGDDPGALYDARYALAPRLVLPGLDARFAVADGQPTPEGYAVVAREGGVALLERR